MARELRTIARLAARRGWRRRRTASLAVIGAATASLALVATTGHEGAWYADGGASAWRVAAGVSAVFVCLVAAAAAGAGAASTLGERRLLAEAPAGRQAAALLLLFDLVGPALAGLAQAPLAVYAARAGVLSGTRAAALAAWPLVSAAIATLVTVALCRRPGLAPLAAVAGALAGSAAGALAVAWVAIA